MITRVNTGIFIFVSVVLFACTTELEEHGLQPEGIDEQGPMMLMNESTSDMVETVETGELAQTQTQVAAPCPGGSLGPGQVIWTLANPSSWGYRVVLEGKNTLTAASLPSQYVDGIYRLNWGCRLAMKVPDSCTATVYPDAIGCCCNLSGDTCQWVDPASMGWSVCP